jgi:hypothetical protein
VKTYGAYAISMTWPAGDNDVDLYVRDPTGAISYFKNMQVDQMHLEHDDLGTLATGYGKRTPNEERTVLRGTTPGQYVIGASLYARRHGAGAIPVSVELWNLQGDDRIVKSRTVYLSRTGDDRTPFRFTLDAAGGVSGFSYLPVNLRESSTRYGGAG